MKTTTAAALSIVTLATILFGGMETLAALAPQAGVEHTVTATIKKTTTPHTMTLTATHRSCQKDPAFRHTVVEIGALAYDIDSTEQAKELELGLQNRYAETITPLFRDQSDISREKINNALQKFMRENANAHLAFLISIVDFPPVSKNNDPCTASPRLSP